MGCMPSPDPAADCYGASFVPTPAIQQFRPQGCNTHADCYDMREPPQWCRLAPNQAWTKEGCHCDPKLSTCVIDRVTRTPRRGFIEYTYCYPIPFWHCP
ncbi:unnamed protein product [Anisakis simplex]|uniref:SVWC domain-containing protein n=1 Tax=Anisakis simplex TaxID=6269 RepID=A0A0M3J372_ANISI|nr:unnamed protein product [Anisakis simplex]